MEQIFAMLFLFQKTSKTNRQVKKIRSKVRFYKPKTLTKVTHGWIRLLKKKQGWNDGRGWKPPWTLKKIL